MHSIGEIQSALESGELSVPELIQERLKLARENKLNAFLDVFEERAMDQARKLQVELDRLGRQIPKDRMPLFGIPLGIKDNLALRGARMTCASRMLETYVAPYTATAVERLESAGAISIGKLNMDEFAMGSSNENSAFGFVEHPTHPGYVPGGSSGGSAASVRSGVCAVALGSDTGGSIRLPASFCGLVGMKPSYGRVSRYGLTAFASSLDQIGPLATSVEDAATVIEAMGGVDHRDGTSVDLPIHGLSQAARTPAELSQVRLGVPKEYFQEGLQPEVRASIENTLKALEKRGAKLVPMTLPLTKYSVSTYYVVAVSEASSNLSRFDGIRFGFRPELQGPELDLGKFYARMRSKFGPEVKRRILLGTYTLSSGYYDAYYLRACRVRRRIQSDFQEAFKHVDAIVAPVSPVTAFQRGDHATDPLKMYLMDIFTIPVNLAGLPALSVPCGVDQKGLSIGLQLIGAQFGEQRLLQVAAAVEREVRV
jgi:aspartyl-tRNA(Asn)/glutamyl-tRNA(Gln) amidotransferase subunit A